MADTTQNDTDNPGDLRTQRDQLAQTNKEQAAQLLAFQQDEQLREAGFGHLSKRQRRAILRDLNEDGTEFSTEAVTEIVKEYGYPLTPLTPPTNDAGNGQDNHQGNDSQGQPQGQSQGQDNDVEDSLTAMDLMRRAQAVAAGNNPQSDFEAEIRGAKSKEELTDLIRTKGARHNIVHEWDVP